MIRPVKETIAYNYISNSSRPCGVFILFFIARKALRTGHQLNIVAFSTRRNVPIEPTIKSGPWVEQATNEELLNEFNGWGSQAITILKEMKNSSKWSIHALNPPLESFVRENVVLVGDAVSFV